MKPVSGHVHPATDKQKEEQIQQNQSYDIEQLDRRELYRTFFVTQISKRNTLERIKCHYQYHHGNIVGMIRIPQQRRDWMQKQHTQHHKNQRKPANKNQRLAYTFSGSSVVYWQNGKNRFPYQRSERPRSSAV